MKKVVGWFGVTVILIGCDASSSFDSNAKQTKVDVATTNQTNAQDDTAITDDASQAADADLKQNSFADPTAITCSSGVNALVSTGSTTIIFSGEATTVSFSLSANPALATGSIGSVVGVATTALIAATYTAPASVTTEETITITATPSDTSIAAASCTLRLIPDGAIGVSDDGKTIGLVGNVYQLPPGTNATTFATAVDWTLAPKPITTIVMPTVSVPNTSFQLGFPGLSSLTQWFAIKLDGNITIPITGTYQFQLAADDGAMVYIDGALVINDDGVHPITTAAGSASLTAGKHIIHIDYFQGPPNFLALALSWEKPGDSAFSIIPADAFSRPSNSP